MARQNSVVVNYKNGFANVQMGNRKIAITRRDDNKHDYMCPVELIPAAIGSWISLTISAVAEHKGIKLKDVEVRIQRESDNNNGGRTSFYIEIDLMGELDDREKVLLFNSARKCDVTKILAGDIGFQYKLLE